jgi:branched-chain amino acid transport system substrate-binding protein
VSFPSFLELAAQQNPKLRTVALVGADAEYPHNALAGARENLKQLGFEIVYDKHLPPTTVDYTPIVRAIKAVNPDIVRGVVSAGFGGYGVGVA